jgi:cardiolipin synthase
MDLLPSFATCAPVAKKFSFLLVAALYAWLIYAAIHPTLPSPQNRIVFYSNQSRQDFRLTLCRAIEQAQSYIHVTMYALSDEKVIRKLHQKALQGVEVKVFYDPKGGSSVLPPPIHAFPIKSKGLMHRKIVVIDDALVFLGSANMTTASLALHDNLSVGFYDPQLALSLLSPSNFFSFPEGKLFLLPHPDALPALLDALNHAKEEIFCSMFTLTHPDLVDALIHAKNRGVKVTVALDYYAGRGAGQKAVKTLLTANVPLLLSQGVQLLHHKWVLIDRKALILGSANWTKAAFTRNLDALLFLDHLSPKEIKYMTSLQHTITLEGTKL